MSSNAPEYEYIDVPSQGYTLPSMPSPQRSDRADLIDKIKPELAVEIIRHKLMGEENINGEWVINPALKKRALSSVGAWELSNLLMGVASINTTISKLADYEIKRRLLSIATTAQKLCISNWKAYEVKNASQLWFVHEVIFTGALVVLKQADGASIQELLKGTVQENRNINSEPKKEGIIKRVLGV